LIGTELEQPRRVLRVERPVVTLNIVGKKAKLVIVEATWNILEALVEGKFKVNGTE